MEASVALGSDNKEFSTFGCVKESRYLCVEAGMGDEPNVRCHPFGVLGGGINRLVCNDFETLCGYNTNAPTGGYCKA